MTQIISWFRTGFKGKTPWDWLELLIVPAVLAIGGFTFDQLQSNREQTRAEQRTQSERAIATDNQREETLQAYLDDISELLLTKKLRTSPPEAEVRNVARIRTLSTLNRLDGERNNTLLQFLRESQLISTTTPIIRLSEADLTKADLASANLQGLDLSETTLVSATLQGANLEGANLRGANLQGANLQGANLKGLDLTETTLVSATLRGANLEEVNLRGANLREAHLEEAKLFLANLEEADLERANLQGARLFLANLKEAKLHGANLEGADLQLANLEGANLYNSHLERADLSATKLQGAILEGATFQRTIYDRHTVWPGNFDTSGKSLEDDSEFPWP